MLVIVNDIKDDEWNYEDIFGDIRCNKIIKVLLENGVYINLCGV